MWILSNFANDNSTGWKRTWIYLCPPSNSFEFLAEFIWQHSYTIKDLCFFKKQSSVSIISVLSSRRKFHGWFHIKLKLKIEGSWNEKTSISRILVSVAFHSNPYCFSKHQQETLLFLQGSKTWFWAIFRAKNETNWTCWSQNKKTRQKAWRSLTLKDPGSHLHPNCETNFQQLPELNFDLQTSQNKGIPDSWENVESFTNYLAGNVKIWKSTLSQKILWVD